ncbi:tyrosine--tRNA ligase [Candidatus Dojkabacteria bacterium]|uniref:tyrosine--tRNA ligase n=1 Tax=Candidatus Dojkabacteria bacterium TaxID=2099670 RepID=A0A955LA77_9BACT|nr:tyrosine--tRNA ligase [Candidatus Dojkabacteria bacterium]
MTKEKLLELLKPITISKVVEKKKHENADRLWIVQIDNGSGVNVQVVTAADNFEVGDLVPHLAPGNVVPGWLITEGQEIKLEERPMRGEMSAGMILAEDEFGLSDDHEGIAVINDENPKFEIRNSKQDELIGKSILDVLSKESIETISKNAGVVEVTPELQEKIDLILSIGDPEKGGEVVGEDQLPEILTSGEELFTYDGFEPSGQMHIAQGIVRAINTNKMIEAGFTFRMWVADWFGYLNNKMGGDMEKIKKVGMYFIEIWKAAGMNLDKTEFLWTSDFVDKQDYWETVMKVMKNTSLNRILRTTEIMGRSETDDLSAAQILYPAMQTTDIFKVMKCQVTQLGMDQRKVNMLAREVGPELGFWKPVVVSHGMLQGLGKPLPKDSDPVDRVISMKMSKSKPDTAIFMTDSAEDVARKIKKAYCPPGEIEDNPILDYCKQIIFEAKYLKRDKPLLENDEFVIKRDEKFGGDIKLKSYKELEDLYKQGEEALHPEDLKNAVIGYLNSLLEPVRNHFEEDQKAKELLEEVQSFQITR